MLKRNLKLVQATRNAGAIPIAVNEPILVSSRSNSPAPIGIILKICRDFTGLYYGIIVLCGGLVGRSVRRLDQVRNKIFTLKYY